MDTVNLKTKQIVTRSLPALIVGGMLGTIWTHGFEGLFISLGLAYLLAFIIGLCLKLPSALHTALVTLILNYLLATYANILVGMAPEALLHQLPGKLADTYGWGLMGLVMTLPAWLLYWFIDFLIVRKYH